MAINENVWNNGRILAEKFHGSLWPKTIVQKGPKCRNHWLKRPHYPHFLCWSQWWQSRGCQMYGHPTTTALKWHNTYFDVFSPFWWLFKGIKAVKSLIQWFSHSNMIIPVLLYTPHCLMTYNYEYWGFLSHLGPRIEHEMVKISSIVAICLGSYRGVRKFHWMNSCQVDFDVA